MALEILAPLAELIGNVAFAFRYGKSRTPVEPVSAPTACLTFLLLGVVVTVILASVIFSSSHQAVLFTLTGIIAVCAVVGWRTRNALGFPFGGFYALSYALSFSAGVTSVLLIVAF